MSQAARQAQRNVVKQLNLLQNNKLNTTMHAAHIGTFRLFFAKSHIQPIG
ncbi:hypothetical protein [Roseovarius albus]|nr:hypothetical protein [Roseovarius albus]